MLFRYDAAPPRMARRPNAVNAAAEPFVGKCLPSAPHPMATRCLLELAQVSDTGSGARRSALLETNRLGGGAKNGICDSVLARRV